MLRRLYNWTMRLAGHKHANAVLAAVSFSESSFFPIPPDIILIPMVLANRLRAFILALNCTISSVMGGLAGYAIGFFVFDSFGQFIIEIYGNADSLNQFQTWYEKWGFWFVFFAGFTPFPYKVFTLGSGFLGLSLTVFIIASILARGLRFFIIAGLLWKFGLPIRNFIELHLHWLFFIFSALLLTGFLMVNYVI